eukprot:SAG31_NODE_2833_length_5023_cov_2.514216_6_plen_90_part_00
MQLRSEQCCALNQLVASLSLRDRSFYPLDQAIECFDCHSKHIAHEELNLVPVLVPGTRVRAVPGRRSPVHGCLIDSCANFKNCVQAVHT